MMMGYEGKKRTLRVFSTLDGRGHSKGYCIRYFTYAFILISYHFQRLDESENDRLWKE